MRRLIVCTFALVALVAALFFAHSFALAAPRHSMPIRPADSSEVQPVFDCWSAVTVIHPLPVGPVTTYYAHFGYTARLFETVPTSDDYTTPTLNVAPPTSFNEGTFTDAYVPAFDPANLPTWYIYTASATVVKTSATQCGGVH